MAASKDDRTSARGFAAMAPEKQRRLASRGGSAVRAENCAFSRDRSLAAAAGAKGGKASPRGGPSPDPGLSATPPQNPSPEAS